LPVGSFIVFDKIDERYIAIDKQILNDNPERYSKVFITTKLIPNKTIKGQAVTEQSGFSEAGTVFINASDISPYFDWKEKNHTIRKLYLDL